MARSMVLIVTLFQCFILSIIVNAQNTINYDYDYNNEQSSTLPPEQSNNPYSLSKSMININSSGFDIAFMSDLYFRMINLNDETDLDKCPIDELVDEILPSDYQVVHDFELSKAVRIDSIDQTFHLIERLIQMARNVSQQTNPILTRLTNQLLFLAYEIQLSPPCMASILKIMNSIQRNELWALKFLDASGKIPSGILDGTLSSVGDYNQCLEIHISDNVADNDQPILNGKYCLARPIIPHPERKTILKQSKNRNSFNIPNQLFDEVADFLYFSNRSLINIGLCLPSTCTAHEIEHAFNSILYPITKIPIEIGPESTCQEKNKAFQPDQYQRMAIYIFGSLFTITLLASIYESFIKQNNPSKSNDNNDENNTRKNFVINQQSSMHMEKDDDQSDQLSLASRLIISFSLVRNTRMLFESKPGKFGSIDLIRFLMLLETMVMHNYYISVLWSALPLSKRLFNGLGPKTGTEFKYGFLRNVHNTDFFFSLTGLLLAYSTLRLLKKTNGKFNYLKFIINIYLRFYPTVFGTILIYYLLPLFGDGPFWHLLDQYFVHSCRQQLISSMLTYNFYIVDIENFVNHYMCNIASWWVNSCYHLILFSPLILLPLHWFHHSVSLIFLPLVIIFGGLTSIGHMIYKDIPYMNQLSKMDSIIEESYYSMYYTWPFIHHISTFTLGIMVGFLILHYPNIYLGGMFGESILTIVFVGISILGLLWTQDLIKAPHDLATLLAEPVANYENYLNITFGKLMFCSGFLWIFYLCCTNRNKFWNNLFTIRQLQPIYNLSLGIYLTNLIPPMLVLYRTRDLIEFDDFLIIQNCIFTFCLTIFLAYILYVLFEKPVLNILKIFNSK